MEKKILIVGDVHDEVGAIRSILSDAGDFDAVLLVGDVCEFRCGRIIHELVSRKKPVVFVPGNHDCVSCWEGSGAVVLMNSTSDVRIGDEIVRVAGFAGVYSPTRRDPLHHTIEDALRLSWREPIDIFLSHQPPTGMCDSTPAGIPGGRNEVLAAVVALEPKLVACGHTHVQCLREGHPLVVNPGLGAAGFYAVLYGSRAEIRWSGYSPDADEFFRRTYSYNEVRRLRDYFRLMHESLVLES